MQGKKRNERPEADYNEKWSASNNRHLSDLRHKNVQNREDGVEKS